MQIKTMHTSRASPPRPVAMLLAAFLILSAVALAGVVIARKALPPYVGRRLTQLEMEEVIARNSTLTSYVHLSPNADFPRSGEIKKITIHYLAANPTLEALGDSYGKWDRRTSSNYAVDTYGNVALYVEEENCSWASSSRENDHQAVNIEVANDEIGGNWHVSDAAYERLIELCADICRRNGIEKLIYTGDENGNLTVHKMFKPNTECPGPYLMSRMEEIAEAVNRKLDSD